MKKKIKKIIRQWFKDLFKSIQKNPENLGYIIFGPIICYYMAIAILDFGYKTMIGYIFACIKGFPKIIEDPQRIIKWAIGFIGTAVMLPQIISIIIPEIEKGTILSIFTTLFILVVIGSIYYDFHKLKSI
jgi:hypothetical protein